MKKDAGILLPVLSLPNSYGCGDFGKEAYEFIDRIAEIGFSIWQILPLQPLGYGNSPYQPYSSKAMDELYVSLDMLKEEGLIKDLKPFNEDASRIDYQDVKAYKRPYLWEAFHTFEGSDEFWAFRNEPWVNTYAQFITFKNKSNLVSWVDWKKEFKFYPEWHSVNLYDYDEEILYEIYVQYVLLKQWKKLRAYANSKGIKIMGDVPFYVGLDSDDVWANKDMFLLDQDSRPTFIAGVPPDGFSATGQRWGNPIYDWDKMKNDHFSFWCERLRYASSLYDITRIDHFRAFETYWKIPASCPTAMEGEWIKAPGYEFFDELFKRYPDIEIVAEDLGDNMDDVYVLRDHFNLKGMVITQQMFDGHDYGDTLSHQIVYTGTHDNMPVKAWFETLKEDHQKEVLKGLRKAKCTNKDFVDAMNSFAMSRRAQTCVLPMCDILRLGKEGRINAPGVLDDVNWSWKLVDFKAFDKEKTRLHKLLVKNERI